MSLYDAMACGHVAGHNIYMAMGSGGATSCWERKLARKRLLCGAYRKGSNKQVSIKL